MGYYRKVDTAENLSPYSEQFENWTGGAATVVDNVALAPDGTMTAASVTDSNSGDYEQVMNTVSKSANRDVYCASVYVNKIAGGATSYFSELALYFGGGTGVGHVIAFNAGDGTSMVWNPTGCWGGVDDVGDHWRVWVAGPDNATNSYVNIQVAPAYGTGKWASSASATGTIYCWGGQLEINHYPSPYVKTTTTSATSAVRRDNHWAKDHNGIWRRHLRLGGPWNSVTEWTNLVDYSAIIVNGGGGWEDSSDFTAVESVASCIEGGLAFKGTSGAAVGGRMVPSALTGFTPTPTYSGNIEVASGIFERVNQTLSKIIIYDPTPTTNYVGVEYNFATDTPSQINSNLTLVDWGWEDLGIGPNGGKLVRLWVAHDSSDADLTGEYRYAQWRTDDNWSGVETGILHHAQYIEIPSGYSFLDNGAPTGPIVNLDATNNSINRESFNIPITFNPQAMTVYCRFIQRWRDGHHAQFSVGGNTGCRLYTANNNGTDGTFFGRFSDGTSTSTCLMQSAYTFAFGDTVELVLTLYSDGSVKGWSSKNGGAWETATAGAADPTIPGAWNTSAAFLNALASDNDYGGFADYQAFKVVQGSITTTAECEWLRGYKENG